MIGYFTDLPDAEAYFADERLETTFWDALTVGSSKDEKTTCLTQAFNRIFYSEEFDLPTAADASAAELVILKKAQGEMAYYLAAHLADEDRRKGLQAQGVIEAGIVKEKYDPGHIDAVAIPQIVKDMLYDWSAYSDVPFHAGDIARVEDYKVKDDVTDMEDEAI